MKRFQGLEDLSPDLFSDPICTVGFFDGVHRGHRQLLYELGVWVGAVGGESVVLTFPEHPLTPLRGIDVPCILPVETRLVELERHGADVTALLDFRTVMRLDAEAFLREVLLERLGCRRLLLGFDSHLGRDRTGTPNSLPLLGRQLGIEVRIASPVLDREGRKIGSSAIRMAIREGDLERAANLLGRPVTIRATVVRGAGRGTGLGTPTANLEIGGELLPPDGVYLVRAFIGDRTAPGIANLGVRPTFGDGGARGLEVHLPDLNEDLYGQIMEVRLQRRIREEQRFESVEALRKQIAQDLQELAQSVADGEI